MIDLHSHVLPGIDDGARDVAGSVEILRAAQADGITRIAATPHVRADWPTSPDAMEAGVRELNALGEDVEVLPGGELDLDYAAALDDGTLRRFGLGGNPNLLLLEMPFVGWPLDLPDRIFGFVVRGFRIVLAHPERNAEVQERPELVAPLVDAGVVVQLTAAAVDGRLGRRAAKSARALVDAGHAHVLASDAHAPAVRAAGLAAAADALGDAALGRWMTDDVPASLLVNEPMPPRPARRRWRTLR